MSTYLNDEVIRMLKTGVPEEVIQAKIKEENNNYCSSRRKPPSFSFVVEAILENIHFLSFEKKKNRASLLRLSERLSS